MALQVVNSSPNTRLNGTEFWVGQDGNVWYRGGDGSVKNMGAAKGTSTTANLALNGANQVDDPLPGGIKPSSTGGSSTGGSSNSGDAQDAAQRAKFKGEIQSKGAQLNAIYDALFGNLDDLTKERTGQLETQYGDQLKSASDQYADALPMIDTSYAALGAGDSTDVTRGHRKAEDGFSSTTKTIGDNKKADIDKLGQFLATQRASIQGDKDSAAQAVASANDTTDVNALRGLRDDINTNINKAGVTKASLGTDAGARGQIQQLTGDAGRYAEVTNALDSILKSSMSGAVKQAATQAVGDSAGLSDADKKKLQAQYGNVYSEQSAL